MAMPTPTPMPITGQLTSLLAAGGGVEEVVVVGETPVPSENETVTVAGGSFVGAVLVFEKDSEAEAVGEVESVAEFSSEDNSPEVGDEVLVRVLFSRLSNVEEDDCCCCSCRFGDCCACVC